MIKDKLFSAAAHVGELAGRVDEDVWRELRLLRDNLAALADQAGHLENGCIPAKPQGHTYGQAS